MRAKSDYSRVLNLESNTSNLKNGRVSGQTRCIAINVTGPALRRSAKIFFYPGNQAERQLEKYDLKNVFKHITDNPLYRSICKGFASFFRQLKTIVGKNHTDTEAEPVQPLRMDEGNEERITPASGSHDTQVMLDMKKNRATMAFEFYRIMDDTNK